MSGLHTVHVRINDAATGQPTPVRIRLTGSDQTYFAPFGRLTVVPTGPGEAVGGNLVLGREQNQFAYIDGSCEVNLPANPITLEVSKGPEYRPLRQTVALGPGKIALRLAIERWIDLRQQQWFSGDVQAHFLTPHAALLEGAAEDLAVVHLLALEWLLPGRHPPVWTIPNILDFSGQEPLVQRPGHLVVVNTLNQGGLLGNLSLLHCHRIVFPLSTGCCANPVCSWTLDAWCDQCHRKGGLTVWTQFGHSSSGDPEQGFAGEALANLILGKIDAIQLDRLDGPRSRQIDEWYRLLACGFRVPLVGGSGKVSNAQVLGGIRTYARLAAGQELNGKHWIEAIRAGRTFVTNGPLLTLTVNGQDPGAVVAVPAGERQVTVRAEARSWVPFERLEIVINGAVVAGTEASGSPCTALLEGNLEIPGSGWLAARCWGSQTVLTGAVPAQVAAHTSPVYLHVPEQPLPVDDISLALLVERLDRMLIWAEHGAQYTNDRQKEALLSVFQAARQQLVQRRGP